MIAGRYTLDREIGRGGMGAVWLGHDEVLGRPVALKRIGLLPGADSTDLARAEREAKLTARLNHPHVVAVFNFVADTDSDHRWLVMEYVDGPTLAQLIRSEGRLSPDDAAPLLWQAADALVAAHAAGIVHRDVKPSNILLDRHRRVKLTDFGIARITGDPMLTQTGLVTGSPAYLAPEVATGQRGDEAVDVWSLGATLFHMLSGRPPYEMGDHVLGGLYRIVNDEPPRLADAGWMAPLLEATMVKDPSRRCSMREVRDFLAAGPGNGVLAAAPGAPDDTLSTLPLGPADDAAVHPVTAPVDDDAVRPEPAPVRATPGSPRRPARPWVLAGLAVALVLAVAVFAVLREGQTADTAAQAPPSPTTSPSGPATSAGPSRTPSPSPSPTRSASPAGATARGMESFIRDYVATVSTNPDRSWKMLTPKFQRESGGLDTYRSFWDPVGKGRILSLSADPRSMVVSYRVRFDNFGNGHRPTVLDLVHRNGRYLIDGERTQGFVPAG